MISKDHFPMIAQISNDGLHRVTYGEKGGLTYDEMRARQPEKYKAIIPGQPGPEDYKVGIVFEGVALSETSLTSHR